MNMESDSDCDSADDKRSMSPNKLLEMFDPLPNAHVMKKLIYFFKPYNIKLNKDKFMRFGINEELDWKQKLESMLFKKGFSKEEK